MADQQTEHAHTEEPPAPAPRTPLQRWNDAVLALYARGYSTMNAHETVDAAYPGLWQEASAEEARRYWAGKPLPPSR